MTDQEKICELRTTLEFLRRACIDGVNHNVGSRESLEHWCKKSLLVLETTAPTQPEPEREERQALFFAASRAINTGARLTGKTTLWGVFEKGWEAHKEWQARAALERK